VTTGSSSSSSSFRSILSRRGDVALLFNLVKFILERFFISEMLDLSSDRSDLREVAFISEEDM
jgi:hypothetical protein